ncbi:class I SAM-dependent methyltransferase [Crocinitomicaceae bacterium]|nr:class I SAM-dependent methyltransferase [Crocinitomicaceae bacterium]
MTIKEVLSVEKIIDLSASVGIVPSAKFHYGWFSYSDWQMDVLKSFNIDESCKILDIGCGPLRFGLEAINYLNDGCYYGIDPYPRYIELGKLLYDAIGMDKKYTVIHDNEFNFHLFETEFDFALAQSVFTHLSREQVILALTNAKKVMKPGAKLLFTNIESSLARGFLYDGRFPMMQGVNMDEKFYRDICEPLNLKLEYNSREHPTQLAHTIIF